MKIVIAGTPISKNRHKCGCRGHKPFAYDPQIKKDMDYVRVQMSNAYNQIWNSENKADVLKATELSEAESFHVVFTFAFPISKNESHGSRNAKLWGFIPYNEKPDNDNLEKFYMDCGTGILWPDDCRIVINESRKYYSENPRTEIEVMVNKSLTLNKKAEDILKVFSPTKLKEFLEDVICFLQFPPERVDEMVEEIQTENKKSFLTTAACFLSEFAEKYGDDLKKIQKFKGLRKDLEEEENFFVSLAKGKFNV